MAPKGKIAIWYSDFLTDSSVLSASIQGRGQVRCWIGLDTRILPNTNKRQLLGLASKLDKTQSIGDLFQFAAVSNGNNGLSVAGRISQSFNFFDDIHAFQYASEHDMLFIEVLGWNRGDEKLRAVGVPA